MREPWDLGMLNEYILGQVIGIPALILGQQLFSFLSLENQRKWTMIASMMAIPGRIGVGPDARIDISVTSAEEVVDVSRQISAFCQRRGIDDERTYYAALCMEEMAGNVVEHGFTMDNKAHSADIRVVHKDDEIILRIRDNCNAFDPSEYHRIMEMGDEGKNVGIRLVYGIAKEVNYQNLLGMNVLTMRI